MTTTPQAPGVGATQDEHLEALSGYQYGWHDSDAAGAAAQRGLSEAVVRHISELKGEPEWMRDLRLKALRLFGKKPMPTWGAELDEIDFDNIKYFVVQTTYGYADQAQAGIATQQPGEQDRVLFMVLGPEQLRGRQQDRTRNQHRH